MTMENDNEKQGAAQRALMNALADSVENATDEEIEEWAKKTQANAERTRATLRRALEAHRKAHLRPINPATSHCCVVCRHPVLFGRVDGVCLDCRREAAALAQRQP